MFGRKCWMELPLSELSVQKQWAEGSDSFRIGIFWFLWDTLLPASLCFFLAFWLWLLWFFRGFLFLILIFIFGVWHINHMYFVPTERELLGGSFEMLGTNIDFGLCIRPLKRRCDQLHQMVHEHSLTFLWIE